MENTQQEIEWTSQIGQDKFAFEALGEKRNGYFLEIGAYDGIKSSNTYVLEKQFGWSGLCVEANPSTFEQLISNRDCECVQMAVSNFTGQVFFEETSTVWDKISEKGNIPVQCTTLTEIFKQNNVPSDIDYMSLDIEGAEVQALEGFPFDTHTCKIITVEHNLYMEGPENKMKIKQILESNGYICVNENVAYTKHGLNNPYEDWFVHNSYYNTYLTYNK
jgi:FkbM family methyltransferase